MEFDRLPTRPVVKSLLSAQAEWDHWLLENHFQRLLDADGLDWHLDVEIQQYPDPEDCHISRWVATLQLKADVDCATLMATGTLDPEEDSRLASLIGEQKVPMRMKPMVHTAKGEKDGRDLLIQLLPELRDSIGKTKLREIKRGLIGRWIESQSQFGAREQSRGW